MKIGRNNDLREGLIRLNKIRAKFFDGPERRSYHRLSASRDSKCVFTIAFIFLFIQAAIISHEMIQ